MDPLAPSYRCILRVGVRPDGQHHTVEFSCLGSPDDNKPLAATLREIADALEAPSVKDPELI